MTIQNLQIHLASNEKTNNGPPPPPSEVVVRRAPERENLPACGEMVFLVSRGCGLLEASLIVRSPKELGLLACEQVRDPGEGVT
jgi:hypothetical protein